MQCPQCNKPLVQEMISGSVIIDYCSGCSGSFFERGEINFFVEDKVVYSYEKKGLIDPIPCTRKCPKCQIQMRQGRLPENLFLVEECEQCLGLWFDRNEFQTLAKIKQKPKKVISAEHKQRIYSKIKPLASLFLSSLLVLLGAYSVLAALVFMLIELNYMSLPRGIIILVAFVLLQFLFTPIFMDQWLRLFGSVTWHAYPYQELDISLAQDLTNISKTLKTPFPRVGIINDKSPEVYTYGRSPSSARIVFSKGIFSTLNKNEFRAVLAHEYGHIRNWDFVIMTFVQLIPIMLDFIYRQLRSKNSKTPSKDEGKLFVIAVIVQIFYLLSNYFVLFISRLREYHADLFSAKVTRDPNSLISALFKLGYGIVRHEKKETRNSPFRAFSIMNFEGASGISLNHSEPNITELESSLVWDLYNPWATFFELNSTHPLVAKRIKRLSYYAETLNQTPIVQFTIEPHESLQDDFIRDALILWSPGIVAFSFGLVYWLTHPAIAILNLSGALMIGFALGQFLRICCRYSRNRSQFHSISSLLKKIKVSPINSIFVTLRGEVIGRGHAGDKFNDDLMLQDNSGIIFLNHNHPLAIFSAWFILTKMKYIIGNLVTVEGWYRREPVPFLEIYRIKTPAFEFYCHTKEWLIITNIVLLATGIFLLKYSYLVR